MIERIKCGIQRNYYRLKFRKAHLKLRKNVHIGGRKSSFEGYNVIGRNTFFSGQLGKYSYIGENCSISATIGRFCSIANSVRTVSGTHPAKNWVTTHPAFFSTLKQCGTTFVSKNYFDEITKRPSIGNDVWIGEGASLIGAIRIADGAIIAAGAVVTKDVPPYAIVGGVPAKVIRYRFEEQEIKQVLASKWWEKDEAWLRENVLPFQRVDRFLEMSGDSK